MSNYSANKGNENDGTRGVFVNNPMEKKNMPNIVVPAQIYLMGADGYTNPLASLGEASPLMSAGTIVRSGMSRRLDEIATIYRECSIAKRIIDMPSEEMTRQWYTLSSGEVDETDLCMLMNLEARHSVKQEITNAIRWARLFGGSIAVIVIQGEEDRMDAPLDPNRLPPECFKGLYVADLTQGITPSMELEDDLDDPDYGLPKYYDINMESGRTQTIRIHHSRVLRFSGRELPHSEMMRNDYWGASELEHPWDEIKKYLSTCENIAQLVFQANLITLKMGNFGADLAYGSDRMKKNLEETIEAENRMRTSFGVHVMSADDSLENHSYNFGGLAEIKESFMMDVAGAAEIPATILFGRSPQGMNATGEADIRNYYDKISQLQERILRPALEKLLPIMTVSCWGFIPDDMKITFNPVMTMSPGEKGRLSRENIEEINAALSSGLITREEARAELRARGNALGTWGSIA